MTNKFSDFFDNKGNENFNSSENNKYCNNNSMNNNEGSKKEQDKIDGKKVKDTYEKYSNMPKQTLINEFVKETARQKSRGMLSDEQINNIQNTLSNYLNESEKEKLNNILNMVKDDNWKDWSSNYK